MARPSLLSIDGKTLSKQALDFIYYVENGADNELACRCSGISFEVVRKWCERGRKVAKELEINENNKALVSYELLKYVEFVTSYERAKGNYEFSKIKIINDFQNGKEGISKHQAESCIRWLKSKYPKKYSESRLNKQEEENENNNRRIVYNGSVPRQ